MSTIKTRRVKKGMQFRSTLADGNPIWEVKRSLGGAWLCEVVDEPFEIDGKVYESDFAGAEKSFLSREILAANAYEDMFKDMRSDHDGFYASLDEGDIVHYNNGFKNFVRCEVVLMPMSRRTSSSQSLWSGNGAIAICLSGEPMGKFTMGIIRNRLLMAQHSSRMQAASLSRVQIIPMTLVR